MPKRRGWIYHALNHPIRREIVRLLGTRRSVGATEFKQLLDIGPGKLYYHLENLGTLIEQDEEKRYRLSGEGREAYDILVSGEAVSVNERTDSLAGLSPLLNAVKPVFLPGWLISYLYENPVRHIPESIILLIVGGWLSHASGLQPLVLFYLNRGLPLYSAMAQFFLSWLVVYGVAEIVCIALFRRRGGDASLLVGSAVSLYPMMLYAVVWLLNSNLGWGLENALGGWVIRGLLLLFQGWTFSVLAVSVSRAKKLSIDRASIVSLATAYVSIAAYILTKGI